MVRFIQAYYNDCMHEESQGELQQRLMTAARQVTVGAQYEHYKGLRYVVQALALREEDGVPCVVYRALYGEKLTWIRPVSSWLEMIEVSGRQVPRFTKITEKG